MTRNGLPRDASLSLTPLSGTFTPIGATSSYRQDRRSVARCGGNALLPPYLCGTMGLIARGLWGNFRARLHQPCTACLRPRGNDRPRCRAILSAASAGLRAVPPPPPPGYGAPTYDSAPLPPPVAPPPGYSQPYQPQPYAGQQQTEAYPPPAPSQSYGQPAYGSGGGFPPQPAAPGFRPPS